MYKSWLVASLPLPALNRRTSKESPCIVPSKASHLQNQGKIIPGAHSEALIEDARVKAQINQIVQEIHEFERNKATLVKISHQIIAVEGKERRIVQAYHEIPQIQ